MLERYGDIWEAVDEDKAAIVITTNGFVNKKGEAIIGSGIALEAKNRYPEFAKALGRFITAHGNEVASKIMPDGVLLYTLPTKPILGPNGEPGWKTKSNIPLIKTSIAQLLYAVGINGDDKIYMPRPGCGSGGLKWEVVKPIIEPYLDDRFTVFHKEL